MLSMATVPAVAAPTDCLGTSVDALTKCTIPLVPPVFSYGVCIASLLSTEVNAEGYCSQQLGPMTGDASVVAFVNCVGNRLTGVPNSMSSVHWQPVGSTGGDGNLCGMYSVIENHGREISGFDHQTLFYEVYPIRNRSVTCPNGMQPVGGNSTSGPDYCVKPPDFPTCEKVGNPIGIATAEKMNSEVDYPVTGASSLSFVRNYRNFGFYRPLLSLENASLGFGDFWRNNYSARILPENQPYLMATALRPGGNEKHFKPNGQEVFNAEGAGDQLSMTASGWLYKDAARGFETYDSNGKLTAIYAKTGDRQLLTYSDATTPLSIAPARGLLINVADDFGRPLNFTYDSNQRMNAMIDPNGNIYGYGFDANEMLAGVNFPDGKSRFYVYDEAGSGAGPYGLNGIIDENNVRFSTYKYRDAYWNTPDSTEHAGGVGKYVRYQNSANSISINDPSGSQITYTTSSVGGVQKISAQSQPAGSGCNASTQSIQYDTNGNKAVVDDFNGNRTCYSSDLSRNLELVRVEGLTTTVACSTVTPAGMRISTGQRKVNTQWHPDWALKTREAAPLKVTTWVYNGQPDPTASNAIASCAPASAVLPDGKPIAVLCKQVEQATTDTTGTSSFSATPTGLARTWSYTYNQFGQVLTVTDPRNNPTTYAYASATTADVTIGDLLSVTNALGHVTQYLKYDRAGRVLRRIDPMANGVTTDITYTPRGWVKTVTVTPSGRPGTPQLTTYTYDAVGLLKNVLLPDATQLGYSYDPAHRLTGVTDGAGNTITYTLDNMGNPKIEQLKDPTGALAKNISRVYDALNRLQSVTGAPQ
ncbi:MAG: RHS repeat protein [Leptothrix sp. (in: b-proteobacteria)]